MSTAALPVYSVTECLADAARAASLETETQVEALLSAAEMTPEQVFERCMYSFEQRWFPSYREIEYKASRYWVAYRALNADLWQRYTAMERNYEATGTRCADAELIAACGAAWKKSGLHHLGRHLRAPAHRHHSEKPRQRQPRKRERPADDTRIRLWLAPDLKQEREADSGIMRGTLR
ncbi:MAG: hypothetical protein LAO78_23830 [Acidobacteriia bacterium]|nr:hypothetical protein [Terriglobia bacterium]